MTTTKKIFALSLIVCFLISLGGFSQALASSFQPPARKPDNAPAPAPAPAKVVEPSVTADKYLVRAHGFTKITFTFSAGTYKANRVRLVRIDTHTGQAVHYNYMPYGPNHPKTRTIDFAATSNQAWQADQHIYLEVYDGNKLLAKSPIIIIKEEVPPKKR
jgi:hypothetical protein